MRRAWIATIAGLSIAVALVPAAQAKPKRLKLKIVLVSMTRTSSGRPEFHFKALEGAKKVGTVVVPHCEGAGLSCQVNGMTNLKVGRVTGEAKIVVVFKSTGNFQHPTPVKYGTGHIQKGNTLEHVRINGTGLPTTVGAQTTMVITY